MRGGQISYFFVEAPNGHLSSAYPIGSAIVTFPIYFLLYWIFRVVEFFQSLFSGVPVDLINLTELSGRGNIYSLQKIVCTIVGGLTVTIFYLITRLKFSSAVALLSTFVFGFATTTWVIGSQGLWQHGILNLAVLSIIFCFLKANRSQDLKLKLLLVTAGFFVGLLPGIRPIGLAYAGAAIAYSIFAYRRQALYLLLGLPSVLLGASWNFYYFGFSLRNFLVGGYSHFAKNGDFVDSYYAWTPQQFWKGFLGHLVSPSRGLLVFSPIVLFTIPGLHQLWRARAKKDEILILCMTMATGLIFLQYCFYKVWDAGWCYGPRFMTDIIAILGLLIAYFIDYWFNHIYKASKFWFRTILVLFLTLLTWSTFTQVVGAFGATNWDGIPYPRRERLWQWQDNQISRHFNHILFKVTDPIGNPKVYEQQFAGEVEKLQTFGERSPTSFPLLVKAGKSRNISVQVKNIGHNQWYSYETGSTWGIAQVRVRLLDKNSKQFVGDPAYLYVSGFPQPGETAQAEGRVQFPKQPGLYALMMDIVISQFDEPQDLQKHPLYAVDIEVRP